MDKIINQGIDMCIEEFQKQNNKDKLESDILDPIIKYIGERLWPYIMYSIVFICCLILLLIYIIYTIHSRA